MNLLFKFHFPDSIKYRAKETVSYGGKQWRAGVNVQSRLISGIGDERSFEVPNIDIEVEDFSGEQRAIIQNYKIIGSLVEIFLDDGTAMGSMVIERFDLGRNVVKYELSGKYGEFIDYITERISYEAFPLTVASAIGQVIPVSFGLINSNSTGSIKAYQVQANKYLVQGTDLDTTTLQGAYLSDGTDITASCSIAASGGRYYVTYSATNPDFIYVNITVGSYYGGSPYDVLKAIINRYFKVFCRGNVYDDSALETFLSNIGYETNFVRYVMNTERTGVDVMRHFCDSYNLDWAVINGVIRCKWLDILDTAADKVYQDGVILSYNSNIQPEEFYNRVFVYGQYDAYSSDYLKKYEFNKFDSQGEYGIKEKIIYAPFLKTNIMIHATAKYAALFNKHPRKDARITVHWKDYSGRSVGDTIEFAHPADETGGASARWYQIRRAEIDDQNNGVTLDLTDITWLRSVDTNFKLLLRSGYGDEYGDFYDDSIGSDKLLSPQLSIVHKTTQALFGTSSVYAWGYRRITTPNHSDFDIFASLATNTTLKASLRVHDFSTTYTNVWSVFSHVQDVNNFWELRISAAGRLAFSIVSGGVTVESLLTPAGSPLLVNTWYEIELIKVGANVGLYVDGVQLAFITLSSTYNFSGTFYIFGNHPLTWYLQAYVAEAFLYNGNLYSAAPNVGLTDSFTSWWHPVTDEAVRIPLSVQQPIAGETLTKGQTYRIKWTVPGCRMMVKLYDATPALVSVISSPVVNDKYLYWTIPAGTASGNYKILVHDVTWKISGWSGVFSIS